MKISVFDILIDNCTEDEYIKRINLRYGIKFTLKEL